ncbi:MAG: hypothetical protein U0X93_18225 [Anaerolineales bacterium]
MRSTVGDLDILVAAKDSAAVMGVRQTSARDVKRQANSNEHRIHRRSPARRCGCIRQMSLDGTAIRDRLERS